VTYLEPWRRRLRELVCRNGRSQGDVAARAGVTEETLSRILTGETGDPKLTTLMAIVQASGGTLGWVLGEPTYTLSADERDKLLAAAAIIREVLSG
jgi:transcriptional regulator with XRE-family HTH domain